MLKSGSAGVENRQLVLIAVRHIAVDHARLERLGALPVRARIPLEDQPGVEPARTAAVGVGVLGSPYAAFCKSYCVK